MNLSYNILVLGVFLSLAVRSSWGISGIVETANIKMGLFGKFGFRVEFCTFMLCLDLYFLFYFFFLLFYYQPCSDVVIVYFMWRRRRGWGKTILFSHGFWDIWLPWYISARCSSYFTDFSHFSKLNNFSNLRKLSKLSNFNTLTASYVSYWYTKRPMTVKYLEYLVYIYINT